MNRGNMKRVLENSRESIPASAEVRAKHRYENLFRDYLDLQKVSRFLPFTFDLCVCFIFLI